MIMILASVFIKGPHNNTLKFIPAKKTASIGRANARPLAKRYE